MQGQVLHSSKTVGIIIVLYALNFTTLYSGCEKRLLVEWQPQFLEFYISSSLRECKEYYFFIIVPKCLSFAPIFEDFKYYSTILFCIMIKRN
jgi:hypothetical protein